MVSLLGFHGDISRYTLALPHFELEAVLSVSGQLRRLLLSEVVHTQQIALRDGADGVADDQVKDPLPHLYLFDQVYIYTS